MAKILLVDDDRDILEVLSLFLQAKGHEISASTNSQDGMKAVKSFQPDLVVLDVMMVQPDEGIVMAQQLRREGFSKPIILLTAISKVTGMTFGKDDDLVPVDAFVDKPVNPDSLLTKINELLKK